MAAPTRRARRTRGAAAAIAVAALLAAGLTACGSDPDLAQAAPTSAVSRRGLVGPWDWPSFGHDAQHTFHGRTTLTPATAAQLSQAWFFPTGDAVTATPTVVDGVVYAGSWDGNFYAVDLATGRERWRFALHPQPAVKPVPGVEPRDPDSDGGLVTSSAWFEPGEGDRPDLVLFGGGYTLYALDAATGHEVWSHDYTGRPERRADPAHDDARIFSSPVVADGKVVVGLSVDGNDGHRGYVVAASLATGDPVWVHETDVDDRGRPRNDGCGNVWSSASVAPDLGLVYLDSSDCHFANDSGDSEAVFALRLSDGTRAWIFRPTRRDVGCDYDFGASVNVGLAADGTTEFVGVGGKDGTYYSLDPGTGRVRWRRNVVFGGMSGGFIGTSALDGTRVVGATGIGDFGRFADDGTELHCAPDDPRDTSHQEPTLHALDTATGEPLWQQRGAASFGPTTVAGQLVVSAVALESTVVVRSVADGSELTRFALPAPCWSGIATVGDALVFGTGASHQGSPAGIYAFTPGGEAPSVPS